MKLGTLKTEHPDGELVVISQNNQLAVKVPHIASHLQQALEDSEKWEKLKKVYADLNNDQCQDSFQVDEKKFHSPLPRSYQWLDGSAYIQHIILVRKARNAEPPENLRTVPLMYQGGSDSFLPPTQDIPLIDPAHGLDFESEVGIVTDFVPMGTKAQDAHKYIKLFLLINDVSLRGLIPGELAMGFGFMQSKPSSSFSPFAITPDELGDSFREGRIFLPLLSNYNDKFFGNPDAGEMFFSFYQLIEHAAKTRSLCAGTIIGSGTVSNEDPSRGSSCLAEKRMLEKINEGDIKTPFMNENDTIEIKMENSQGQNLFGTIFQKVTKV